MFVILYRGKDMREREIKTCVHTCAAAVSMTISQYRGRGRMGNQNRAIHILI